LATCRPPAAFLKENAVQRPIPGTFAAYTFLAVSSLFVFAVFAGAMWLTGQGAIWLGHTLPHRLL
jgi:hypothetical protein